MAFDNNNDILMYLAIGLLIYLILNNKKENFLIRGLDATNRDKVGSNLRGDVSGNLIGSVLPQIPLLDADKNQTAEKTMYPPSLSSFATYNNIQPPLSKPPYVKLPYVDTNTRTPPMSPGPSPPGSVRALSPMTPKVIDKQPHIIRVPTVNESKFGPSDTRPRDLADPKSNFLLGVNIRDPQNSKFSAQAPPEKPKLLSKDLLPAPISGPNKWFETPEVGVKVEDANLLADAITKVGVDTVGSTRKNPSYDLRGNMPCPKFVVSPWQNSSYENDINLKSLY
jgi:hypothetical protein